MNHFYSLLTLNKLKDSYKKIVRDLIVTNDLERLDILTKGSYHDIMLLGYPKPFADAVCDLDKKFAAKELKKAANYGIKIITPLDNSYPYLLKQIYDFPICLYCIGDCSCLSSESISIVGSRKTSKAGEEITYKMAMGLADNRITITSGLAYGVDIKAHLGAVESGFTIAVLGSGLNRVYPKVHIKYLDKICKNGCVITEFPIDEGAVGHNFPKRNRIISGLSKGVVIIEASIRSGSLITANLALEQGRDVFAVPVSPVFKNNGTNMLIKQGATLVENYKDILDYYGYDSKTAKNEVDQLSELSENEATVIKALQLQALTIDDLILTTNLEQTEIFTLLMNMELTDTITKGNDGRYYSNI